MVFNHAINQGSAPENLDVYSDVKVVDNGGDITAPASEALSAYIKPFCFHQEHLKKLVHVHHIYNLIEKYTTVGEFQFVFREERSMEQEFLEIRPDNWQSNKNI